MVEVSFLDLIKTRRSIRSYLDKPVPKEIIEKIIDCARFSPTAMGREPWHFTVVTNKELIREIVEEIKGKIKLMLRLKFILRFFYPDLTDKNFLSLAKQRGYSKEDLFFYNAPVLIFVSTSKKTPHGLKDSFLAGQNIMLASHGLGLGTCLIGFGELVNRSKRVLKKLNLPPGHKIQATIILGYPKTKPSSLPQRRTDNIVFY